MSTVPLDTIQTLADHGHHATALILLDELLSKDQHSLPALYLLASCLEKCGRIEDAVSAYQLCTLLDPDPYEALVSLADLLRGSEEFSDAIAAAESAISLRPQCGEAHACKATSLVYVERFEEAVETAGHAISLDSTIPQSWHALALAMVKLGQYERAEAAYTQALTLIPDWHRVRMERGITQFLRRHFKAGLDDYEARWSMDGAQSHRHEGIETWDGQPFEGNLLLWSEQGLGDEIFFLGFLPWILQRQPHIILEVDPRLVDLCTRSFPDALVLPRNSERLAGLPVSRALAMGSLLKVVSEGESALPTVFGPYLRVPSVKATSEQQRGRFRVGLFWRSDRPMIGKAKSVDLSLLAPLAKIANVDLISLQYGDTAEERRLFHQQTGLAIKKPEYDLYNDIDRLASIIASCDAIASIAGVPAHLAAAVGVPTYVLSPSPLGRLWLWDNMGSIPCWYSQAKVYLSRNSSSITEAIDRLIHDLTVMAQAHGAGSHSEAIGSR
ncbi:tetratricopeptide repeat protein [Synechococcus sp. GreenBA-s]|nr:tetratricopeptide repeat protein [Synechococcus sp. GreenBA-s]